jgi:phospholipase C
MHPPISALIHNLPFDPPSSLLGGEALLASIYDTIRTPSSSSGSNYLNTFLMVAFDEGVAPTITSPHHRRCRRTAQHLPVRWASPSTGWGVRVPTIAISAWI